MTGLSARGEMSFQPRVSLVVPAYNAQATLNACLTSLLDLTYPRDKMELLIVDNNSRDETRVIIESFAPRVRYLYEKKRGPAAARNRGIAHAHGDIVAFTDADCIVEHDWLTELVQPLANEQVGIVGGAIRSTRLDTAVEKFGEQINNQAKAICEYKPAYVASANWASSRGVLLDAGKFDANLRGGEDTDLAWRILQRGKKLVYQATAIVYHRNENTVRGLFLQGFQHGYNSVRVNRKHKKFLETFGYRRIQREGYVQLVRTLRAYLATHSMEAWCDFVFNGGKKLGKLVGSIRTGYLEL